MSPPSPADKYIFLAGGALAILALYTTHVQLKTFRARCVSKPSLTMPDAGVDQTTEDAIKLETLESLARGVNFDIRNAALKIITERAATEMNIRYILSKIRSPDPTLRLQSLRALRCFAYSGNISKLCNRPTFDSLVICLKNCLPTATAPADPFSEKEALYVIARLLGSYYLGREMIVEAGFIEWLKRVSVAGYTNIVEAVFDPERFDLTDTSLWQIVTTLDESPESRRLLEQAGLRPRRRDADGRFAEVQVRGAVGAPGRGTGGRLGVEAAGIVERLDAALAEYLEDENSAMAGWDDGGDINVI